MAAASLYHLGIELKNLVHDLRYSDSRARAIARLNECYNEWLQATAASADELPDEDANKLFVDMIPTLLNLSMSCPYKAVREGTGALLAKVRAAGKHVPEPVHRGVSHFIPDSKIVPLDVEDEETLQELQEAFDSDGRLTHMTRLMAFHPRYLRTFREALTHVLLGDGPLSIPVRHLLAVMGASRHSCNYLVKIYSAHFLEAGGDANWLDGPHALPTKLRNICDFSAILAHKPWILTSESIGKLVKSNSFTDAWSLPELVHAALILSRFHTLTGFIYGLGCVEEVDIKNSATDLPSARSSAAPSRGMSPVKAVAERSEPVEMAPVTARTLLTRMRQLDVKPTASVVAPVPRKAAVEPPVSALSALAHGFEPNGTESVPFYSEFSPAHHETFCFQTFSWQDEAYATLARYNERMAELLSQEFDTIKTLTYETMGDEKEVDTRKFRWAVWNYVFSTYGVTDREYIYAEVDVLVQGSLRDWIKIIATTPQRAERERKLYDSFLDLQDSEKAHMCLLVVEARHMAAMLYFLSALSNYADR